MLRTTGSLLKLRPRYVPYTPPPLARRSGDFRCHNCSNEWHSRHVWVTKTTHRCYQGEHCDKCGAHNKPRYIGQLERNDFFDERVTPHVHGRGRSTSIAESKKIHTPRVRRMDTPGRWNPGKQK